MTAEDMQAARDRIIALLPDGQSVLMALSRTASREEWHALRDFYCEAVATFYDGFAISWNGLDISERQRTAERAGLCWSRARDVSQLEWAHVTQSVKRQLWRWLQRPVTDLQNSVIPDCASESDRNC